MTTTDWSDRFVHHATLDIPKYWMLAPIEQLGKARELAQMDKYEFGQLLTQRGILRHYGTEELEDDLAYTHR